MVHLLLLLAAVHAQDPVQVRARLVDQEIPAGETTVLRVEVETEGERAQIQQFRSLPPGLELEGTRNFDQRQFSIPGGTRRFISREFVLRARAPGRYRIPSLEVIVEGQSYRTRSMLLGVTAAPSAPGAGAAEESSDGVVLRTWLDADTVYVGQQVTMYAEAMFSQDARFRLRRAPEYEQPSPAGFWVHDLPDRRRPTNRTVGGQTYEVQSFQRAFFPMSPGEYEIPPAHLQYEIRRGLLNAPERRAMSSDPLRLVVLPVPADRPPAFTGAVGSYTLTGSLEPARVAAGEAAVLTVDVEGVGDVKTLPPPELPELAELDVYPPSEEAETEIREGRIRGSKRFSWVLIPRQSGELELPEIRYPYFDPAMGDFQTASVSPMTLQVTPGTATDGDVAPQPRLRYLDTSPGGTDPLAWVGSNTFAAAQVVPLLLLGLAFGWSRRRSRAQRPSARALRRRRAERLKALRERLQDGGPGFFGDAERFVREWTADRLAILPREVGSRQALAAAGLGPETIDELNRLLDRLASARYAPESPGPEVRRDLLRALEAVLDRVDREAPTTRAGEVRATATAAVSITLVMLLLPLPAMASGAVGQGPPTAFQEGVTAFDEERYPAAADAFDRYVEGRPDDPAGWYNLGTSYHRAGHPGYATWAWLRALPLDPRDDDIRHNLRIAGVPPELLDRVTPPFRLRTSELLLLASLGWLVTGVAGAYWLVRRRPRAAMTAGVALLLTLVLAGAGWTSTRDPELLIVLEPTTLRAGPTLRADPVLELEPGTGLTPVESYGDWVRARTPRGDEGWIEATVTGEL